MSSLDGWVGGEVVHSLHSMQAGMLGGFAAVSHSSWGTPPAACRHVVCQLACTSQFLSNACLPAQPPRSYAPVPLPPNRSYDIHLGAVGDPFVSRFRHHPRRPERLDLDAIAAAAQLFAGTHNFSNFANVSEDGARKNPVKTISRYELLPLDAGVRWARACKSARLHVLGLVRLGTSTGGATVT